MNKADTTLLINKELTRIGIPLEHEHASYFRDGYLFAQKQALTLTSVGCSVWIVQDQVTLVVHGMFTTQAKAISYANGHNRMAITNLTLG